MTTGIVELTDLQYTPTPFEWLGKYTHYHIDAEDQKVFSLGESEWFCTECNELVEDPYTGECWCSTEPLFIPIEATLVDMSPRR